LVRPILKGEADLGQRHPDVKDLRTNPSSSTQTRMSSGDAEGEAPQYAANETGPVVSKRPRTATGTESRDVDRSANMSYLLRKLWGDNAGQDIAEYAVMLAVILILVVGTVRLVGSHANNVFSNVASAVQ
jgi:Flp pilus assembly pilin Flp